MATNTGDNLPKVKSDLLAKAQLYGLLASTFSDMQDVCKKAAGAPNAAGGDKGVTPFMGNTVASMDPAAPAPQEPKTLHDGQELGDGNGVPPSARVAPPKKLGQRMDGSMAATPSEPMDNSADVPPASDPEMSEPNVVKPTNPEMDDGLRSLAATLQGCRRLAALIDEGSYEIKKKPGSASRKRKER